MMLTNTRHYTAIVVAACALLVVLANASALSTLAPANIAVPHERTVTFGINLALNQSLAQYYYANQLDTLIGLQTWMIWWNALPVESRTTPYGDVIRVALRVETWSEYTTCFTPYAENALCAIYGNMSQDASIDYLFVPVDCMGVDIRQCALNDHGVSLMVSSADSSEAYYAIPGSYGSPTANTLSLTSWLVYLRVAKASTIAIIAINDYVYQSEMCRGVYNHATENGLQVVQYFDSMPFDWNTRGAIDDASDASVWQNALDVVIGKNPDAVIVCDYGYGAEFALDYFKRKNWTPKSMAISPLTRTLDNPSLLDFVTTFSQYDSVAKFPPQTQFTDSLGYDALVRSMHHTRPSPVAAKATLAGMMFSNAILSSSSNKTADVSRAMLVTHLDSFMGPVSMDGNNRQTLPMLVVQLLNSNTITNVVGPASAAVESYIYPMPTWSERVFKPEWGKSGVEIASTVLILIAIAHSIGWMIMLVYYRDHGIIRAASPLFCHLILAANMLIAASLVSWMPSLVSSAVCKTRPFLLPLGYMLMYASLLAKTDRINKIYNKTTVTLFAISNTQVAARVVAIISIPIVIAIMVVLLPPAMTSTMHITDAYRLSLNFRAGVLSHG